MTVTADAQSNTSIITMSQMRRLFFRDCLRVRALHAVNLIVVGTVFVSVSPIFGWTLDSVGFVAKQSVLIGVFGLIISILMTAAHYGHLASVHPALPLPQAQRSQAAILAVTLQWLLALAVGGLILGVGPLGPLHAGPRDLINILALFLASAVLLSSTPVALDPPRLARFAPVWIAVAMLHALPEWSTPLFVIAVWALGYRTRPSVKIPAQAMLAWLLATGLDFTMLAIVFPILFVAPTLIETGITMPSPPRLLERLGGVPRVLVSSLVLAPLMIAGLLGIWWLIFGRFTDNDFLPLVTVFVVMGSGDGHSGNLVGTRGHQHARFLRWTTLLPRSKREVLGLRLLELVGLVTVGALYPLAIGGSWGEAVGSMALTLVWGMVVVGGWARAASAPYTGVAMRNELFLAMVLIATTGLGFPAAAKGTLMILGVPSLTVALVGSLVCMLFAVTGLWTWWRRTPG